MHTITAATSMRCFAAKAHHCPEVSRLLVRLEEGAENLGQLAEFFEVCHGQGVDPLVAERGESQADEPLVVGVAAAFDEAEVLGAVDESDGAVVADHEGPGDIGDRRAAGVVVASDRQQELVLGRRHAEIGGLFFAEMAEAAQSDPELQNPGELLVREHAFDPNGRLKPRRG
jgi:hypothetical protein